MPNDFWNERYRRDGFFFGTEPADFVVAQANWLPADARVLCVCDGEGRNSAYLAQLGHEVTAFDASEVAVAKARGLFVKRGVLVSTQVATMEQWDWEETFDAVVAIFIQFASPPEREANLQRLAKAVRPGGLLLLHGYAPRQVGYGTGGPPLSENMYTLDFLNQQFPGWTVLHEADEDRMVDEGAGHSGTSALIDFVARKP